jgi:hypothetical protein
MRLYRNGTTQLWPIDANRIFQVIFAQSLSITRPCQTAVFFFSINKTFSISSEYKSQEQTKLEMKPQEHGALGWPLPKK